MSRAEKFKKLGLYNIIMWHEKYEEDYPGYFEEQRIKLAMVHRQ